MIEPALFTDDQEAIHTILDTVWDALVRDLVRWQRVFEHLGDKSTADQLMVLGVDVAQRILVGRRLRAGDDPDPPRRRRRKRAPTPPTGPEAVP
jgi:hypothetical protein